MIFKAHGYQDYCIARMLDEPRLGLFLDMGLGKTVITLVAVCKLKYDRQLVSKVLVIAPKRVAENTWSHEVEKWDQLSLLRVSVVLGSREQRIQALRADADVYVINRDNVDWLVGYCGAVWPFDTVVIDEFSSFKNGQCKRFKALRSILPSIKRLYGLTGTPAPNGLEDLWAQIYLLDGGKRLGRFISHFRERYFDYNPYRHEFKPKKGADEAIKKLIGDICVSMRAEDYLTLPECVTVDTPVRLNKKARAAYEQLERDMLLSVDERDLEVTTAVALTGKLLQLSGGAAYDPNGDVVVVHDDKVDAFSEMLEGLGGEHALVFYGYKHEIPRLVRAAKHLDLRVRLMSGPADERAWNAGKVDVLLAHPASAAFGLNLQDGGHHVIWFCPTWSLELYQQANKRLHRQGQKAPVIVHRLVVDKTVDQDVIAALRGKCGAQDAILAALKARISKTKAVKGGGGSE